MLTIIFCRLLFLYKIRRWDYNPGIHTALGHYNNRALVLNKVNREKRKSENLKWKNTRSRGISCIQLLYYKIQFFFFLYIQYILLYFNINWILMHIYTDSYYNNKCSQCKEEGMSCSSLLRIHQYNKSCNYMHIINIK